MDPPSAALDRASPDPTSSSLMYGFKLGDMVWGKVKSHPWWPGHIFNEAFASSSVRRSRREGHVLVAFYGDSSYGWFDPEELIQFDPHYPEKSRQTVSRTFAKAVDEALDELRRRGALGVTCYCRSPINFRPVSVPGYLAVDVPGFEPGGIYSLDFIKAARESFSPKGALSFVKDSALSFTMGKFGKTADWIKSRALLLGVRKAWYEEYDDTYAEAFGVEPVRPPKEVPGLLDQPFRDTLCGPLRIAEALGDNKSSSRQKTRSSSASSSKKNKYLLKRRDETPSSSPPLPDLPLISNAVKQPQSPPGSTGVKPTSTTIQSSSSAKTSKADNYVFQKRYTAPEKPQPVPKPMQEDSKPPGYEFISDLAQQLDVSEPPPGFTNGIQSTLPLNPPISGAVSALLNLEEKPPTIDPNNGTELVPVLATVESVQPKFEIPDVDPKTKGVVKKEKGNESSVGYLNKKKKREPETVGDLPRDDHKGDLKKKKKKRAPETDTDLTHDVDNADFNKKEPKSITDLSRDTTELVKKKKREPESITDLTLNDSLDLKKKKTKKRKLESITDVTEILRDGDGSRRKARPELPQLQTKHLQEATSISTPTLDFDSPERDLSQVLSDLSGLAMDPFYGAERSAPDIVRHVFLRFRNRVYQKSLVLPTDDEGTADIKDVRDQREQKPLFRSDDPTKSGRKRGPSDRQEELSEKRIKKLDRLKGLANEKKTVLTLKAPEEPVLPLQAKPETVKKRQEPKIAHPAYLVLRFLQRTSLPSVATLKAKFARFGTIDGLATRVFWKTYTCKVLFMYKSDAEDACSYASSNDLFGQAKVKYSVREIDPPADVPPAEPHFRPGNRNGNGAPMHSPRLSTGPLKSSIKRRVDEAGPSTHATAANVRKKVYFMLSNNAIIGHGGDVLPLPPPAPPRPDIVQNPVIVRLGSPPGGPTDPRPRPRPHAYISPPPPAAPEASQYPFPDPETQPYRQQLPLQPQPLSSQLPVLLPPSQLPLEMPVLLPLPPPPPPPSSQMPVLLPPPQLSSLQMPIPSSSQMPVSLPPPPPSGLEKPLSAPSEAQPSHPLGSGNADITSRMLSLLCRCNSIVANVRSFPGYVPYSPL